MKLVAAKCPCCNANIEVSPDAETTKCRYCGSAILVEDAIKKYTIEFSGEVGISGISSLENDLKLGSQYLEVKEWTNAYHMFSNAIDKKADCYAAWHGCLCALTQNFSFADKSWAPISGSRGFEFVIGNCFKYGNLNQKKEMETELSNFIVSQTNRVLPLIKDRHYRK